MITAQLKDVGWQAGLSQTVLNSCTAAEPLERQLVP